jgi:hypothetical protein
MSNSSSFTLQYVQITALQLYFTKLKNRKTVLKETKFFNSSKILRGERVTIEQALIVEL